MRLFYSRISFLMLFLINVAFAENTKQAQDFNKIKKQVEDFKTNLSVSETHIEALKEDLLKSRAKQISDQYDQAIEEVLQNRNLSETSIISLLIRFIERNPSQGNLTAHALLTLAGQILKRQKANF